MTAYEIYSVLREIPEDALKNTALEYLDTCITDQLGDESFQGAREVRLIVEQTGADQYSYKLRIA
jgi:hypothetical protein